MTQLSQEESRAKKPNCLHDLQGKYGKISVISIRSQTKINSFKNPATQSNNQKEESWNGYKSLLISAVH